MALTFGSFLFLLAAGAPMVFVLGVAGALTLAIDGSTPLVVVAQRLFNGLDSFPLLAIPFFVLAGIVMEQGGIARAIVELATALVGWVRGSLLMVATVTATGLSAISGSGSADTAAISSILMPEMKRRGYDLDYATVTVASAGALGPIIPPSIIMVVLAMISDLSVGAMFLGGVFPGLIAAAGLLVGHWLYTAREPERYADAEPFRWPRLGRAFRQALPALSMPVIVGGRDHRRRGDADRGGRAGGAGRAADRRLRLPRTQAARPAADDAQDRRHLGRGDDHHRHRLDLLLAGRDPERARHAGRLVRGQCRLRLGLPAAGEPAAAGRGHVHGEHLRHPDPDAGADADRRRARHRPAAFRRGGHAQPVDRADHAALWDLPVRCLHRRRAQRDAGGTAGLDPADPARS